MIISYQVLSRGTVVAAGSVTGNTFSVMTTPEMAPSARIVVYYVRADGEIVTDSVGFSVDGVFQNEVIILNKGLTYTVCNVHLKKVISERFQSQFSDNALMILN